MHGSWGAGKRAGRLTKHGIDMDGGNESPEVVTEDVAAHSTRVLLSTATQRDNLRNTELLDASCSASRTRVYIQRQYHCRCINTAPGTSGGSTERWRVP